MPLTRRSFFTAAGAAALPVALAGCGFTKSSDATPSSGSGGSQTLAFTTWGTDAELAGFKSAIAGFQRACQNLCVRTDLV